MEEDLIQINGKITINVDVSVKNVIYVKKNMFVILLPVVVKMESVQQVLCMVQQLFVMKLQKQKLRQSTKKQKLFQQILMKRKHPVKCKMFIFYLHFINYYSIIDKCQYLLLFDKMSSKTKTFNTISLHKFGINRNYILKTKQKRIIKSKI